MLKLVKGKRVLHDNSGVINVCCIILTILVLFFIYISFITDKLSKEEYDSVYQLYTEINAIDENGRSAFYTNNLLKVLDKTTILTNLRKDSLKYSIIVSDTMISLLSEDYDIDYIISYVNRCELNFKDFKNLDVNSELFELYRGFLNNLNVGNITDEDVNSFVSDTYNIIEKEQNELLKINTFNTILFVGIILIYILVYYIIRKIKKYKGCKK